MDSFQELTLSSRTESRMNGLDDDDIHVGENVSITSGMKGLYSKVRIVNVHNSSEKKEKTMIFFQ